MAEKNTRTSLLSQPGKRGLARREMKPESAGLLAEILAVVDHDFGKQLSGGRRRICNRIGSRLNGTQDILLLGTAGSNNRHIRNSARILATISGVLAAPDTLRISAPAAKRPAISISPETMVVMTGISTTCFIFAMVSFVMGALTTTPEAPDAQSTPPDAPSGLRWSYRRPLPQTQHLRDTDDGWVMEAGA